MKVAFEVSDKFPDLKDFTLSLPRNFRNTGRVLHDGRNIIKVIESNYGPLVVKNFRGMYLFNRIAYSFFRKSKAERSYLFSSILNERGISTPPSVSWIDCYQMGMLTESFYVSGFLPYRTLGETIAFLSDARHPGKTRLLECLAAFTFRLHDLGIFHIDYSLGNILVSGEFDNPAFFLVDLNRMRFGNIAYNTGLENFSTMHLHEDDLRILISEYARLNRQSPEEAIAWFRKFNERKWYLKRMRRRFRKNTIARVEKLLGQQH